MPKSGQAHGGAQFPCPALLALSAISIAPPEISLRSGLIPRLGQQQFALQSIQFRFLKTFIVFLHQRKRLAQSCAGFGESPPLHAGIRQDAQIVRKRQSSAGATIGVQPILQEPHPLLHPALLQQAARGVERPRRMPESKPLFRGDSNLLVASRLRLHPQPAMLVKPSPYDAMRIQG